MKILNYSKQISENDSQCLVCPHECILGQEQLGICRNRIGSRIDGIASVIPYKPNYFSNMAVEPIEKKPFKMYLAGTKTLSSGKMGCQLFCQFCENFKTSQLTMTDNSKKFSNEELIKIAKEKDCSSICLTYNEPTTQYEYIVSFSKKCYNSGLRFVLKTNAYINKSPWELICKNVDAINIDWKGSAKQYRDVAMVDKYVVLDRIQEAFDCGVHIEISIPVYSHIEMNEEYEKFASFLSDMGKEIIDPLTNTYSNIPVHLLKIFPAYNFENIKSTSDEKIEIVKGIFEKYNVPVFCS